jgi:integrase
MSLELGADARSDERWLPLVLEHLGEAGLFTPQSERRLRRTLVRFEAYLRRGHGVDRLAEASAVHIEAFVHAPSASGGEVRQPSLATMHFRRAVIRLAFRAGRELGLASGDPTLDLCLPFRSSLKTRPMSDAEVALCRSASLISLDETLRPAAWAPAEATARTSEIPTIRARDLDLGSGTVFIHGGKRRDPRWGRLSGWGSRQLERRLRALRIDATSQVLLAGSGQRTEEAKQAAACTVISEVLQRAGLGDEPDVRPASIAGWAGATAFAEGASVDEVARMLGLRSLDAAARTIGLEWRTQ